MKQPELGRKISELRMAKGLTQEELVERCNISVRTIQRIEAGEVTPRSYTIKTILAALESDLNAISDQEQSIFHAIISGIKRLFLLDIDLEKPSGFLTKQLNIAWVFGIIYLFASTVVGIADFFLIREERHIYDEWVYFSAKIVTLISLAFFVRGFILVGHLFKNYLLRVISLIMIIAYTLITFYDIFFMHPGMSDVYITMLPMAFTFGVIAIVFGIALIRLRKAVGRLAEYAGILEIIIGGTLITIILSPIALVLTYPAGIIQIIILFKTKELIQQKENEIAIP